MSDITPAPGTPQTNHKAYVATAMSFLGVFLTALLAEWTDTDPLSARDFVVALAAGVVSGGVTGGLTWQVKNRPM